MAEEGYRRRLAIAGSTGSVGTQALDVARSTRGAFDVVAIGARSSVDLLARQAEEFRPSVVALAEKERAPELARRLPAGVELRAGCDALGSLAEEDVDVVLNGVVGFAGLDVTVSTLEQGRTLALANKESLVAGAPVVQRARASRGALILPVDSEHCAIHQCLAGSARSSVARLVLTASGGPFRGRSATELENVTVSDALAHPTWQMGPKITVDSSTLMNKGLEVLEARELFGIDIDRIDVVVHPQSIVHSMVEFSDGATIAQLSNPDMRLPIGYCLSYPDRLGTQFGSIDWSLLSRLDFEPPDAATFECLALAFEAGRLGGAAPAWLNAANEVAVACFLEGRIAWREIAAVVRDALERFEPTELTSTADVVAADAKARSVAAAAVASKGKAA